MQESPVVPELAAVLVAVAILVRAVAHLVREAHGGGPTLPGR